MQRIRILELGGGQTLEGTRFTVYDIVPYLKKGRHPAYIAAVTGLEVEQVEALVKYFEEHKDAVMAWDRVIEERIARGNPPEIQAKLEASRGKARAMREELSKKRQNDAHDAADQRLG